MRLPRRPVGEEGGAGPAAFRGSHLSAFLGTQSCASCHRADLAFTGNHRPDDPLFPVATGAFDDLLGTRNAPTAMYMSFSPSFAFVVEEEDGEVDTADRRPRPPWGWARGHARAASGRAVHQSARDGVAKQGERDRGVRSAEYAPLFEDVFGTGLWPDTDVVYAKLTEAIAAFESTDEFAPFSSKFDAMLRGTAELSEPEARGFALFQDPTRATASRATPAIRIAATRRPGCSPTSPTTTSACRGTLASRTTPIRRPSTSACAGNPASPRSLAGPDDPDAFVESLCGAFKVPTLRNVARPRPTCTTATSTSLRDVVEVLRHARYQPQQAGTSRARWSPNKFDDLPDA